MLSMYLISRENNRLNLGIRCLRYFCQKNGFSLLDIAYRHLPTQLSFTQLEDTGRGTIKPPSYQHAPMTPDFDQEAIDAMSYDGLPPLQAKISTSDIVIFTNLTSVFLKSNRRIEQMFSAANDEPGTVVVKDGQFTRQSNGSGLTTVGSPLGLADIDFEDSTKDGLVIDPFLSEIPNLVVGEETIIRAVDGLQFASPDMLSYLRLPYRGGVTIAVTPRESSGLLSGLSTGAAHTLEDGAIIHDVSVLHVMVSMSSPINRNTRRIRCEFRKVVEGELPLVVTVNSVDVMASLIQLKQEPEEISEKSIRMTFLGAPEAHLLATEIGNAGVGVILSRVRPFPNDWQSRRTYVMFITLFDERRLLKRCGLPGPPLSEDSALDVLLSHNVTMGIGLDIFGLGPQKSTAPNTRSDAAWLARNYHSPIALALVNLETLLGVDTRDREKPSSFVAVARPQNLPFTNMFAMPHAYHSSVFTYHVANTRLSKAQTSNHNHDCENVRHNDDHDKPPSEYMALLAADLRVHHHRQSWIVYRLERNAKLFLVLLLSVFITYLGVWPQTSALVQAHMVEFIKDNLALIRFAITGAARAVYIIMIWYIVAYCPEVVILELVIRRPLCMVEAYLNRLLAWI
ncbi:uncharacterized protein EV420DRAFT_1643335 [Desarmillaria tabescens]|uniref:Uncharacterized protein n=1 Tax=Armillaria tabescens TaxID=1929756 RepID=A0AA39N4N0_ARMTA|nr:uncharacterized protein EV420DRAFT_1643335 [Desarmillaria tabescens]KAK0457981.1 hypothetical protein EV420DRAFT_1643335 [Desarmillaria tabescens]